jgi:hypothetical protein
MYAKSCNGRRYFDANTDSWLIFGALRQHVRNYLCAMNCGQAKRVFGVNKLFRRVYCEWVEIVCEKFTDFFSIIIKYGRESDVGDARIVEEEHVN